MLPGLRAGDTWKWKGGLSGLQGDSYRVAEAHLREEDPVMQGPTGNPAAPLSPGQAGVIS